MSKHSLDNSSSSDAKRARTAGAVPMYYDLNPADWQFNPNQDNTMIYIGHKDDKNRPIRCQLPRMRTPFGAASPYTPKGAPPPPSEKKNVELDVADKDLIDWAATIDQAIVEYLIGSGIIKNGKKDVDENFIRMVYRGMIPDGKDDYNPLMRTKALKEGRHTTNVRVVTNPGSETSELTYYNGTLDDIGPGDEIIPIIDLAGLWYISNGVGMLLRLTDVMVFKKTSASDTVFNLPGVKGARMIESDPVAEAAEEAPPVATEEVDEGDPFA